MERKPNAQLSLTDLLSCSSAQLDHWADDETAFTHDSVEEGGRLLGGENLREIADLRALPRWRERERSATPHEVYFVDGRMRILARVLAGNDVLLLAEAAAGHARWRRDGGLDMGFSQRRPPRLKRIVGAGERLVDRVTKSEGTLRLGERLFFNLTGSRQTADVPSGEVAYQAVCNVMQNLETEEVRSLSGVPGLVVRDGTVHRGDPPFMAGFGPCGLVKRIHYLRLGRPPEGATPEEQELSRWAEQAVFELEKGERTPFFSSEILADPGQARVFSYTRLVRRDPYSLWKGLVRLEVLAGIEGLARLKRSIGSFFDALAGLLPTLSGDYPWKRLPENIFPMIALEEHLGRYFLSPMYIRTLFNRQVRRDREWIESSVR